MPISDYEHAYNSGWRDGRKALLEEQKAARLARVTMLVESGAISIDTIFDSRRTLVCKCAANVSW